MISIEIGIVHDMEEGRRVDDKEVDGIEGKFWDDFLGVLWDLYPEYRLWILFRHRELRFYFQSNENFMPRDLSVKFEPGFSGMYIPR
jgi:hypothetical protein